jgi:membrane protease YdiL (CAAX protease family)
MAMTAAAPPATAADPSSAQEHHFRAVRQLRTYADVAIVLAILISVNLIAHFTTAWASVATIPLAALAMIALSRRLGFTWAELGLSREHGKSGLKYALGAVALVLVVVGVGVALPFTRPFFLVDRFATLSGAVVASMVIIPLQTVIPEELAFRGVLHGSLARAMGVRGALVVGSLLFGFWHIASSLGLTAGNRGLSAFLEAGLLGQILGILGAVAATTAAGVVFIWLRQRSGSILAPIALHWSANGMGALAAALVWHASG